MAFVEVTYTPTSWTEEPWIDVHNPWGFAWGASWGMTWQEEDVTNTTWVEE